MSWQMDACVGRAWLDLGRPRSCPSLSCHVLRSRHTLEGLVWDDHGYNPGFGGDARVGGDGGDRPH
eukprot:4148177-Prymnesium_polylepis.1